MISRENEHARKIPGKIIVKSRPFRGFFFTFTPHIAVRDSRAPLLKNTPFPANLCSSMGVPCHTKWTPRGLNPCVETRTTHHKDSTHHSDHSSSSSPQNTVCVLTDHHPVNHQVESKNTQTSPDSDIMERSEIRQISNPVTVNIILYQKNSARRTVDSRSVSEEQCVQHIVHFRDTQDHWSHKHLNRAPYALRSTRCRHGYLLSLGETKKRTPLKTDHLSCKACSGP